MHSSEESFSKNFSSNFSSPLQFSTEKCTKNYAERCGHFRVELRSLSRILSIHKQNFWPNKEWLTEVNHREQIMRGEPRKESKSREENQETQFARIRSRKSGEANRATPFWTEIPAVIVGPIASGDNRPTGKRRTAGRKRADLQKRWTFLEFLA